jgi:hypothetical protein
VTDTEGDEVTTALLWATRHPDRLPDPPTEVVNAQAGKRALLAKIATQRRGPTRDQRRLEAHYKAVLDAYEARVVEVYRNR